MRRASVQFVIFVSRGEITYRSSSPSFCHYIPLTTMLGGLSSKGAVSNIVGG